MPGNVGYIFIMFEVTDTDTLHMLKSKVYFNNSGQIFYY